MGPHNQKRSLQGVSEENMWYNENLFRLFVIIKTNSIIFNVSRIAIKFCHQILSLLGYLSLAIQWCGAYRLALVGLLVGLPVA